MRSRGRCFSIVEMTICLEILEGDAHSLINQEYHSGFQGALYF